MYLMGTHIPIYVEGDRTWVDNSWYSDLDLRRQFFSERFGPNGSGLNPNVARRAIRDERWKLIRETGEADELYDLVDDPEEKQELLSTNPTPLELEAYDRLDAALLELLDS